jgi:uncharacterized protein (DUF1501 family)
MSTSRRNFIGTSLLATGSLMVPKFLKAFERVNMTNLNAEKKLVVIQLSGGNDGLNSIIPYRNDIYYKLRPTLAIPKTLVLPLNDEFALHPALAPLHKIVDEGNICFINGVGYPNPDFSHFRSMDIWQSASGSGKLYGSGWIGRYLDACCSDTIKPHIALETDGYLSLALKGEQHNGIATTDPEKLLKLLKDPFLNDASTQHAYDDHENVDYLYKVLSDTKASTNYLAEKVSAYTTKQIYPDSGFAKKLKTISQLIQSNAETRVYYLSISGFDTHVNQLHAQDKVLSVVSSGIAAFVNDLTRGNAWKDTCIMVFSEFGRRVAQNAGGGTDHGSANNVWVLSGSLKKKGFYNSHPDLTDLKDGNLIYSIDFREIYATLLNKWLGVDDVFVLKDKFKFLSFI